MLQHHGASSLSPTMLRITTYWERHQAQSKLSAEENDISNVLKNDYTLCDRQQGKSTHKDVTERLQCISNLMRTQDSLSSKTKQRINIQIALPLNAEKHACISTYNYIILIH